MMPQRAGDGQVLEGFMLDDLDDTSIAEYRLSFAATKPGHPWHSLDTKGLLEQLGCWRRNRESGDYGLTLAGLLMFGKYDAIVATDAAPNYHVDFRDYGEHGIPGHTWSERLFPDGTWESNLFQFYQRSWVKLAAALKGPTTGLQADATSVHNALREAVVNALIHTDYRVPGGVVFERYADHLSIENPGTLMVSQEQLRRGGVSQCRNRMLQRMFTLIGGCDQAGVGYRRIREGWRNQLWPEPQLTTQVRPDRVRLELVMRSDFPEQLFTIEKGVSRRSRAR